MEFIKGGTLIFDFTGKSARGGGTVLQGKQENVTPSAELFVQAEARKMQIQKEAQEAEAAQSKSDKGKEGDTAKFPNRYGVGSGKGRRVLVKPGNDIFHRSELYETPETAITKDTHQQAMSTIMKVTSWNNLTWRNGEAEMK